LLLTQSNYFVNFVTAHAVCLILVQAW
jgi:hypothetical protein